MEKEIWKNVKGYEGMYQVSTYGNVRSLGFTVQSKLKNVKTVFRKGRVLKPCFNTYGYVHVNLKKDGKMRSLTIHRLVALAFIKNTENKKEINHINGVKTDNMIENLEWCTSSENTLHAIRTGLQKPKGYWKGTIKNRRDYYARTI